MKIHPVNENSAIIYFSNKVSIEIADKVSHAYHLLKADLGDILVDIIPSYTSILLSCDLRKTGLRGFINDLQRSLMNINYQPSTPDIANRIILPVYYGEDVAWDHQAISEHTQLPFSEIIALHTSEIYRVFAIGFAPGFAYLGNTNPLISMPRKANPRKAIPKGSVAIADQQSAIYPEQSPGGWQIIGRTPINLFDLTQPNLSKFEMGAEVKFEAIDRDTFLAMGGQIDAQ
ncbi:MAG: allophanate hydrolase subunit 1 [Psychromonas sp.]